MSDATITPKELAAELGVDQKSIRSLARKMASETPGGGGRWAFPADFADAIRDRVKNGTGRKTIVASLKVNSGE